MASKAIGFLNFKFGADLSGFDRAMKKAQKNLKKFGKSIQRTGKTLTMGLTLPLVALGKVSIDAFDAQQKAIAQVEAGLKSTGNMVGFTSEKLQQMADDLQSKTLFGDEEILQGATAQLLTFTNIAGVQFAKTQELVLDLATRLDGDLKGASIMLGKALNDPVANLSALSRAGIQFSKEQKETIKSLVETNQLAEAQNIILAELEKQYGGSAEAAALAGSGPIKQLQNELSDLSEQIGKRLLPFVKSFVTWIKELAEKFDGLSDSTKDNIVFWGLILAAIGPVLIIIGKMSIGISALIPIIAKLGTFLLANPYILLAAAIAAVAYAIYDFTSALNFQIDVQKELGDLNTKAQKSIAKDLVNIDLLTSAIKDENTSLDDKLKALNTLKETYPGYYDAIDETTLSTQNLDAATETLTKNLMQVAKLTAYKDKLIEINRQILDLEKSTDIDLSTKVTIGGGIVLALGPLGQLIGELTGKTKEFQTTVQKDINVNKIIELNKLLEELTAETIELESEVNKNNQTFKKFEHTTKKTVKPVAEVKKGTKELTEETEKNTYSILDNIIASTNQLDQFSLAEDQFKGMITWTKQLTDAQKLGASGFQMFGDILTSSLDSALDNQENFFKLFIKNIKRAIRSLLVQLAVMTLLQALMGGGKAAFSLSNIKQNLGTIMNVQLAEGGLVTGPTTALIGEVSTVSNPEVVAPLDKLKSMIGGGGNQHITVTGKLVGNDIFLSNAKAGVNRLRTT
tara:strand:- start:1347 stop:3572 length:2226 start_codon:yes stop_codon:yes gene_type:complete